MRYQNGDKEQAEECHERTDMTRRRAVQSRRRKMKSGWKRKDKMKKV